MDGSSEPSSPTDTFRTDSPRFQFPPKAKNNHTSSADNRNKRARKDVSAGTAAAFCLSEDLSPSPKKARAFTFGAQEFLSEAEESDKASVNLQRTSSLLSRNVPNFPKVPLSPDADSLCSFSVKPPAFGSRRRMSRSLPELRDIQFVSVLPDLEEEESDTSEVEEGGEPEPCETRTPRQARSPRQRKLDFILCSICQSLGLGNFWRFPYYCYSNGGGPFVLAYLILMVLCGVPILCMEFAIGQLTQAGPISAFGQLCPLMKGIGVANMMLSFWITAYYSVLVSWTLFYTFNSFYSPPRWTRCTNTWNSDMCHEQSPVALSVPDPSVMTTTTASFFDSTNTTDMSRFSDILAPTFPADSLTDSDVTNSAEVTGNLSLQNTVIIGTLTSHTDQNFTHPAVEFVHLKMLETSKSIGEAGELRFELLAAVLFVWLMTYFALRKTEFFRRTTIYCLTIASHLLLFSIFLRTVALEGAKNGLHYLFQPDWMKITEPRVWLYALAQVFHSLGIILGPTIIMGSCHKLQNNLLRDTIVLTAITLITVLLISCVTFGTLGHLALKLNQPVEHVLNDDPSTVFVLYSIVISTMPVPSFWGVLFFLIFLCLGLDSQIKLMATLVSALKESYTFSIKQRFHGHSLFLAALCGVCFFATILYLTQAGIYYLQLVDHYVAVLAVAVLALLEVCTLGWLYGSGNLASSIQQMTGKNPSYFYKVTWMVLSPLLITLILAYSAIMLKGNVIQRNYSYPMWAHGVGWLLFSLTLCWVPLLALIAYRKAPKIHVFSRVNFTLQPKNRAYSDSMWEPKPMIILNESTYNDDYSDFKMAQLPSLANSLQSFTSERQSGVEKPDHETNF